MVQVQEARSPDSAVSREDVLRLIPQYELKALLKRHHIQREVIIGLIGLRGDGKSASGACLSLIDYMLEGIPVWSNMNVKCDLQIDNETAQKYGLGYGGVVHYATQELEKETLLRLDDRYRRGCLFIDEINIQYANVRRAMANTNVDFNIVIQQLRKFGTSLIYTVIDEMFIDPQLRTLTDVFIKSEETALSAEGLLLKKQPGFDFKWLIYPMSGYLVGREKSYYVTKKPLPPVYFHFGLFRGIYDDKQFQRKGIYTTSMKGDKGEISADISAEPDVELAEEANKWGWLEEKAKQLKEMGIVELEAPYLWQFLGIAERGLTPFEMGRYLPTYGITRQRFNNRTHQWVYRVDDYAIEGAASKPAA